MTQRLLLMTSLAALVAGFVAGNASAQSGAVAPEITFFSSTSMSGARFTVTGDRKYLTLPYTPRSVALQGGGSWQVCSQTEYRGTCQIVSSNDLSFTFGPVRSIRKLQVTAPAQWREIVRLNVRDRAERDVATATDRKTLFRKVMICSERNTIRIRRAELQLGNRQWQRLFVPLVLEQGKCSNEIDLLGNGRRIRAVRFEYEAWTVGMARGSISVKALPQVSVQPR